jgi:hypothetical protein
MTVGASGVKKVWWIWGVSHPNSRHFVGAAFPSAIIDVPACTASQIYHFLPILSIIFIAFSPFSSSKYPSGARLKALVGAAMSPQNKLPQASHNPAPDADADGCNTR